MSIHKGIADQNVNHRIQPGRKPTAKRFSADHKEVKETDLEG